VSEPPVGATVHATALVLGEHGILIRGPAGAGKSSLARELVARAQEAGRHGALISDDRVVLTATHGRLIARAVPAIAGLLEIRGLGIVEVPHQEAALVRLVVDLDEDPTRHPEQSALITVLEGVELPQVVVNRALAASVVVWWFGHLRDRFVTVP
jgi:serine kinase of HPr protein (carbohydrate metabolism regulator)